MIIYFTYNFKIVTLWYAATFTFFKFLVLPCLGYSQTKPYTGKLFSGEFHPPIISFSMMCQVFNIFVPMMTNPIHKSPFKPDIITCLFTHVPFVSQNMIPFLQKRLIQFRIFHYLFSRHGILFPIIT